MNPLGVFGLFFIGPNARLIAGIDAFETTRRVKAEQPDCTVLLMAEPYEAAWLHFDPVDGASRGICKEHLFEELEDIVTHEFAMADYKKAFETMISGEGIKVLLDMGR